MLQKCSLWEVASVFFNNPEKNFELMEISKEINLAHTSVKRHLETLLELKIVLKKPVAFGRKSNFCYYGNKNEPIFTHYKKIYNLDTLYHSKVIEKIVSKCQPNSIVLFGSFQKGEDTIKSDIDLFVESQEMEISLKKVSNRNIELHFKNNFKDFPKELRSNIANGIILHGFLEVYND
jgi:predicted nucleotidyltransferase